MIAAIWGAILLSLFVTVVAGLFDMKANEINAIAKVDISNSATKFIQKAYKNFVAKKRYYIFMSKLNPEFKSNFTNTIN